MIFLFSFFFFGIPSLSRCSMRCSNSFHLHLDECGAVFSVNISVDRFITLCPVTSLLYFWGWWETKSIFKLPIMSPAQPVSTHLILTKWQWPRQRAASDRSHYLPPCGLNAACSSWSWCERPGVSLETWKMLHTTGSTHYRGGLISHPDLTRNKQRTKRCWLLLMSLLSGCTGHLLLKLVQPLQGVGVGQSLSVKEHEHELLF